MDFFRGNGSPIPGLRSSPSSSNVTQQADPSPENTSDQEQIIQNKFSYYFMHRTGKLMDSTVEEQTKKFIFWVKRLDAPIEKKASEVQKFYAFMSKRLHNFPGFDGWSSEQVDEIVTGMERFVMVNIHSAVFNPAEDRERNQLLDARIRSLIWILPKHLDFTLPSDSEQADRQLAIAQSHLLQETTDRRNKTPHDKIRGMVQCCNALHDLFKIAHDAAAGADELLPMLIYTIIVAAPPDLYATIQYIDRFLPSDTLASGETAYHFTNMCCAQQFLESLSHDKLSLSEEEFTHFMEGHSSHLEEALTTKFASGLLDNLTRVKECEERLKKLRGFHGKLAGNMEQLRGDVRSHRTKVEAEVTEMMGLFNSLQTDMGQLMAS